MPASGKNKPVPAWRWTAEKEKAAQLVAQGRLTTTRIAEKLGVAPGQIRKWKDAPEFNERVDQIISTFGTKMTNLAIARQASRIEAINDRWVKLHEVIDSRAEWYGKSSGKKDVGDAPGGTTGVLCRTVKAVGTGRGARIFIEHQVDTGLLKEIRALELQAAQELGQFVPNKGEQLTAEVIIREVKGANVDAI